MRVSSRSAETGPYHFWMRDTISLKIKSIEKTKKSEIMKWDIGKLIRKE